MASQYTPKCVVCGSQDDCATCKRVNTIARLRAEAYETSNMEMRINLLKKAQQLEATPWQ